MTAAKAQFLFLLKSYINEEKLPDGYHFDVSRVFSLAKIHNVLPMIFDIASGSADDVSLFKGEVVRLIGHQIIKNAAFCQLYKELIAEGIEPVILKGPVCASCYNNPDYRLSSDFDVLLNKEQLKHFESYLLRNGFDRKGEAFINGNNGLYIEASTELGEGNGEIKRLADEAFNAFESRLTEIDGYTTLSVTENLIYLIYHAFKHFISSGIGIRQLVDIMMFVKKHENAINHSQLVSSLKHIGVYTFACNAFYLLEEIFSFKSELFNYKEDLSIICFDEFLADILDAGVFGKSTEDRLHSAAIVASAVSKEKGNGVLKTIFPSFRVMKGKYPLLRYLPFLLPFFWLFRIFEYSVKAIGKQNVSPINSIQLARTRVELMKKMNIIQDE